VNAKSKHTLSGICRIISRPGENQAWQRRQPRAQLQHDEEQSEAEVCRHYFSPNRFYCVETLCAPCGVVLAWTLFDKSESPTHILNWLAQVYPTEESRPSFVAIDKACQVCVLLLLSKQNMTLYLGTTYCHSEPLLGKLAEYNSLYCRHLPL